MQIQIKTMKEIESNAKKTRAAVINNFFFQNDKKATNKNKGVLSKQH